MSVVVTGNTSKDKYVHEFNANFSIDGIEMNELYENETDSQAI